MREPTLKLAAVGVGGIWHTHAKNLALLGGNRVVAVCDLNEAGRKKVAAELDCRAYRDIREMLGNEPDLDAVIACTPPTVRLQVVEAAADCRLPVFVEKPPAFTMDDASKVLRVIERTRVPVVVGFMYRYLPAVDRLKELIADRPISLVQSQFFCPAATGWPLPGWFYIKERSGGHVLDQAIHVMDLVRYIAGDVTQVHTYGSNVIRPKAPDFTIEDSSSTNLRFASGASGVHIHSWAHSEFTGSVTVIGKDYRLTVHLDHRVHGFVADRAIDQTFPPPPEAASHHYEEMRAFLGALRSRDFSSLRSPYSDAAKSLATVVAMNRSIERGAPVDVILN